MKTFLAYVHSAMEKHNIIFPRWNNTIYSLYSYLRNDVYLSESPVLVILLKVACDVVDLVTHNAFAFIGMLICVVLVF